MDLKLKRRPTVVHVHASLGFIVKACATRAVIYLFVGCQLFPWLLTFPMTTIYYSTFGEIHLFTDLLIVLLCYPKLDKVATSWHLLCNTVTLFLIHFLGEEYLKYLQVCLLALECQHKCVDAACFGWSYAKWCQHYLHWNANMAQSGRRWHTDKIHDNGETMGDEVKWIFTMSDSSI